eukprot:scaffold332600_cov23-Prasinocladus_malaysianus.AAC.1
MATCDRSPTVLVWHALFVPYECDECLLLKPYHPKLTTGTHSLYSYHLLPDENPYKNRKP